MRVKAKKVSMPQIYQPTTGFPTRLIMTPTINFTPTQCVFDRELIERLEGSGPRYTSYPTADRFHGGFGVGEYEHWLEQRKKQLMSTLGHYVLFSNQPQQVQELTLRSECWFVPLELEPADSVCRISFPAMM